MLAAVGAFLTMASGTATADVSVNCGDEAWCYTP
jgi:hypothetical protein